MFNFPPFFKAISHPVRQRILNILHQEKELSVNNLVKKLKLSQSTVSYHLAILKKAKVINSREEGTKIFYSLCCETVVRCCSSMQKFIKKA